MGDWITVREAAQILGVHMSAVPKMIRRDDLSRRSDRPILNRGQVLDLRYARDAAAAEAVARRHRPPETPSPPNDQHEWLLAAPAGSVMGISRWSLDPRPPWSLAQRHA